VRTAHLASRRFQHFPDVLHPCGDGGEFHKPPARSSGDNGGQGGFTRSGWAPQNERTRCSSVMRIRQLAQRSPRHQRLRLANHLIQSLRSKRHGERHRRAPQTRIRHGPMLASPTPRRSRLKPLDQQSGSNRAIRRQKAYATVAAVSGAASASCTPGEATRA